MRRTMTLNLDGAEMAALEQMAKDADMTKTGIIRQALRLRHLIRARERDGYELAWRNIATGVVTTMLLDLPKMAQPGKAVRG